MKVISELIAGVRGAENGSAQLFRRATSTLATVYADYDGTVALVQPLDLDSFGGVEVYVNEEVDVRVADEDGTVIRSFCPMSTANDVEYIGSSFRGARYSDALAGVNQPTTAQAIFDKWLTSAGMPDFNVSVGGVETTLQDAFSSVAGLFINVKAPQYGAVGDGVTDDTVAVQAAITAAALTKGIVLFPAGAYKITAKLTVPIDVSLWGFGPGASILVLSHATQNLLEYGAGTNSGFQEIRGLFLSAGVASSGLFIDITAAGNRSLRIVNSIISDGALHDGNQISVAGLSSSVLQLESSIMAMGTPPLNAACITADNATSRVELSNSRFLVVGAYTGTVILCRKLKSVACTYDMSSVSAGTYICISLSATAQAAIVGNEFIVGSGTSSALSMASNTSTTMVYEAANIGLSTFTTPFSGFNANTNNPQIQVLTRESMVRNLTDNGAAVDLQGNIYGTVILTRSAAGGAQALTSTVGPPGSRLVVVIVNDGFGVIAADPSVNSGGFYVGNPSITKPTANKVSVATFTAVVTGGTGAWVSDSTDLTDF